MSMKPPVWRGARSMRALVSTMAVAVVGLTMTTAASAVAPPDGRGYELVSPVDKLGGLPNFPTGGASQAFIGNSALTGASGDGNRLLWMSVEAFADAKTSMQMSYQSERTAGGWQTTQASPDPVSEHPFALISKSIIVDATDDLSRRIIPSQEPFDPLIQGSFSGIFKVNVFLQETNPNTLSWVSRPNAGPSTADVRAFYQGRDETANHILFATPEPLTPNAAGLLGAGLYDFTGGQAELVNVDNGGTAIPCGATLGFLSGLGPSFNNGGVIRGAVTSDGSRIAFSVPDQSFDSGDPSCTDPTKLFVRKNGTTSEASADQRTVPDPLTNRPVQFQGGSVVGPDKVFFTSDQALTDSALDGTADRGLLYEYDVDSGELTLLTPNDTVTPEVSGVVAVSSDGARVFFVAKGQLTPDAPPSTVALSLYMYENGQITFIYQSEDFPALGRMTGFDAKRPVRLSPDDNKLVFQTQDSLAGFNAADTLQIYLYDVETATLTCVSCPSDGRDPVGDAWLQRDVPAPMRETLSRNLLDDGRVYFDTPTSLVPQDSNQRVDVYEWDNGEVKLISGGRGSDGSFLIDTGNQGRDVFFVTTDGLVPQDTDGDLDIYDARVGGGFPVPPPAPKVCSDDECQGPRTTAPVLPDESSSRVVGDGNASAGNKTTLHVRPISAKARRASARSGQLALVLDVGSAGTAHVVAKARIGGRARVVGRATEDAARARALHVDLTLSPKARRQLAKAGKLKMTVTVSFTGAGSRKATITLVQSAQAGR